ncbi:MAG TPA: helix-turn-helix domain-containing protein [Patescibacteria group bacterium]|nr:helix-turn-helix domain-containing protein [Patescibacteria group bacterium]
MTNEKKEWLTVEETAEYLKAAKITIYRLLERREINASKLGKVWRIRRDEVDRYLDTRKSVSTNLEMPGVFAGFDLREVCESLQKHENELQEAIQMMSIIKNQAISREEIHDMALAAGLDIMKERHQEEAAERKRLATLAKQGRTLKYAECVRCADLGPAKEGKTSHVYCGRESERNLDFTGNSMEKCPFFHELKGE